MIIPPTKELISLVSLLAHSEAMASGDLPGFCRLLNHETAHRLKIDRVSVWLFNATGDALTLIDLYKLAEACHSEGVVLPESSFAEEFRHLKQDRYVDAADACHDPRTAGYVEGYLRPNGIASMLDVSIRHGDQLLGTLCFELTRGIESWPEEIISFATALGDQVALCILQRQSRETARIAADRDAALEANQAKSAFLANMSHELRTPLNAILGFATLIQRETPPADPRHEKLAIIRKSGEHLLTLINDILDLSKIEAGRIELHPEDCDLGALLGDTISLLENRAREKGLNLHLDQSSSFPKFVRVDAEKLRRCLINIVGNAIKYTDKGHIAVALRTDARADADNRVRLVFTVTDTGRGIATEHRQRLFRPFERAAGHTDVEGTGLGLAITREYVRLMGGDITVESEAGVGSAFRFDIPATPLAEEAILRLPRHDTEIVAVGGAAAHPVLVVEDHLENRLYLRLILSRFGFPITEVENGAEALRHLREGGAPAIILLDRRMPVMDGIAAAKAMRALPGGAALRIVAVTAEAFAEDRAAMLAAGCDAFIRKPFGESELLETLAALLPLTLVRDHPPEAATGDTGIVAALAALPAHQAAALERAAAAADGEAAAEILTPHPETHRLLQPLLNAYRFDTVADLLREARCG